MDLKKLPNHVLWSYVGDCLWLWIIVCDWPFPTTDNQYMSIVIDLKIKELLQYIRCMYLWSGVALPTSWCESFLFSFVLLSTLVHYFIPTAVWNKTKESPTFQRKGAVFKQHQVEMRKVEIHLIFFSLISCKLSLISLQGVDSFVRFEWSLNSFY